jgi:hypothetical protein
MRQSDSQNLVIYKQRNYAFLMLVMILAIGLLVTAITRQQQVITPQAISAAKVAGPIVAIGGSGGSSAAGPTAGGAVPCGVNIDPFNGGGNPSAGELSGFGWTRIVYKQNGGLGSGGFQSSGAQVLMIFNQESFWGGGPGQWNGDMNGYASGFAGALGAALDQSGPLVGAVEIWNEPDLAGGAPLSPANFGILARAAVPVIKAHGKQAILGGFASGPGTVNTYISAFGSAGSQADGIGLHPYTQSASSFAGYLGGISTSLPAWITEYSWNGAPGGDNPVSYITSFLGALASSGKVSNAIIYAWSDAMNPGFGIKEKPGTKEAILANCGVSPSVSVTPITGTPTPTPTPTTSISVVPSVEGKVDPETAEYLAEPANWPLNSCQVKQDTTNGIESPIGSLAIGIKLRKCTDNQNDPAINTGWADNLSLPYTCTGDTSKDWTAGYAYTGGMREFPLVKFLAASDPTTANQYLTLCRALSFRNLTDNRPLPRDGGSAAPFQLFFTNEFPGLGRFIRGSDTSVNIKVPLLGGASACGILNWNDISNGLINQDPDKKPFRLHPLSLGERKHTGGPDINQPGLIDSVLSFIINLFKAVFFQNGAIPANEQTLPTAMCVQSPGAAITKINTSDEKIMRFASDNPQGPYEYIITKNNFELTQNEVCDSQFRYASVSKNGENMDVTGAECKVDGISQTFKQNENAEQAGFVSRQTFPPFKCPTVQVCGMDVTCETGSDAIYRACRGQGKNVNNIGGDPYLKWSRGGYEQTDLIGLAKTIFNVWYQERINIPFKIIHKENVGIKTNWGLRVYDLQFPPNTSTPVPLISDGDLRNQIYGYNQSLNTSAGQDFSMSNVSNSYLKPYVSALATPAKYLYVYLGGYSLATTQSGEGTTGVSKVDLNYFFPWVGQIPRMLERTSVFFENSLDGDTVKHLKNSAVCLKDLSLTKPNLKDVEIDFCDCPCTKGQAICDCLARNNTETDPLETWLSAPRTSNPLTSGAGLGDPFVPPPGTQQCIPPAPSPTITFTPTPPVTTTPGQCQMDSLSGGMATPVDNPTFTTYAGHVGVDAGKPNGTPVYAVGAGRVVFVRNTIINDSIYKNGTGAQCYFGLNNASNSCDWSSMADVVDQYNGWWRQYGNTIGVLYNDAVIVYGHLNNGSIRVNVGDCVLRNQQIAEVDNTGNSTGSHLHFEVRKLDCTAYKQSCAYKNDPGTMFTGPYGLSSSLSTPRTATSDPIPPGSVPGGPPVCTPTPVPSVRPTVFQCPPSAGTFESLLEKAATYINSQRDSVRWEAAWAVFYNESHHRCIATHSAWASTEDANRISPPVFAGTIPGSAVYNYKDKCTDDPNQLTLYADTQAQDGIGKGLGEQIPGNMLSIVRGSTALMDSCLTSLGVDRSIGQENSTDPGGAFFDSVTDTTVKAYYQANFSRKRVGDVVCAIMIYLGNQVKNQNGGSYVPASAWTDSIARLGIGSWYTPAAPCTYSSTATSYCDRGLARYTFATQSGGNIPSQCTGTTPTGTTPTGTTPTLGPVADNGVCPNNVAVSQWTDGPSHSLCEYRRSYPQSYDATDLPGTGITRVKAPVTGVYRLIAPWDNPYNQCTGNGTPYDGGWVLETTVSGITYRLVHVKPDSAAEYDSHSLNNGNPITAGTELMGLYDGVAATRNGINYNAGLVPGNGCWGARHVHFNIVGASASDFVRRYCSNAGAPFAATGWSTAPNTCCTSANNCNIAL